MIKKEVKNELFSQDVHQAPIQPKIASANVTKIKREAAKNQKQDIKVTNFSKFENRGLPQEFELDPNEKVEISFRLNSLSIFEKVMEVLGPLTKEVQFNCLPQGLYLASLDSTQACMIECLMSDVGTLKEYYFSGQGDSILVMNVEHCTKTLRLIQNDNDIYFRKVIQDPTLQGRFVDGSVDCLFSGWVNMALGSAPLNKCQVPQGSGIAGTFSCDPSRFKKAMDQMNSMGIDTVQFACTEDTCIVTGNGDNGGCEIIFKDTRADQENKDFMPNEVYSIDIRPEYKMFCKGTYHTKFLVNFAKTAVIGSLVTLSWQVNGPLKIYYPLGDVDGSGGHFCFHIAGKADLEDDDW